MVKSVTLGYRWEGLALHQWAFTHTDLLAIALPVNRMAERESSTIGGWSDRFGVLLLYQVGEDSPDFVWQLSRLNPDIVLCYCYTYRLSKSVLAIPRLGCVNIHPGRLPEYRGRRPVEDALSKGETELWACLHYMNEEFDAGEIIAQAPVEREGGLQEMRAALTKAGLRLLEEKWSNIVEK